MMSYLAWLHVGVAIWILPSHLCHATKDSVGVTEVTVQNSSQISGEAFIQEIPHATDVITSKSKPRYKRQADEEDVVNQFEIERVSPPYELSYEAPPLGNYVENFWDIKTINATKDEFFSYYDFEVQDRETVNSQEQNSTARTSPSPEKKKAAPNRTSSREQNDKEHVVTGSGKRSPEKGSLNQYEQHHSFSSNFGNYSLIEVHEDDEVHGIDLVPFGERSPLVLSKYDDEHVISRSPGSRLSRGPPADFILFYQQGKKNSDAAKPDQRGEDKKSFKTGTKILLLNYQKSSLKHSAKGITNSTFNSFESGNLNLTLTGKGNITGKGQISRKEIYIPFGKRISAQAGSRLPRLKQEEHQIPEIQSRDGKIKEKEENPSEVLRKGLYYTPINGNRKVIIQKLTKDTSTNLSAGVQNITTRLPLIRVLKPAAQQNHKTDGRNSTTQVPVTVYFRSGKAVKGIQIPNSVGSGTPVNSTDRPAGTIPSSIVRLAKFTTRKTKPQRDPKLATTNGTTATKTQTEFPKLLSSTPEAIPLVNGSPKRNTRPPTVNLKIPNIKSLSTPAAPPPTTAERSKYPNPVTSARVPAKLLQRNQQSESSTTNLPTRTVEEETTSTQLPPPSLRDIFAVRYESLRMTTGKLATVPSVTEGLAEVTTQMKRRGKSKVVQVLQPQGKRTTKNIDVSVSKTVVVQTTTRKPWLASLATREPLQVTKNVTDRTGRADKRAKIQALNRNSPSPQLNTNQTSTTSSPAELSIPSPKKARKIHFEPKRKKRPYQELPTAANLDVALTSSTYSTQAIEGTITAPSPITARNPRTAAAFKASLATTLSPKPPGRHRLTANPTESTTVITHSPRLENPTTNNSPKSPVTGSTRGRSRKQKSSRKTSATSSQSPSTKAYPLSIGVVVSSDIKAHNKPGLPLLVLIQPTKRPGRTVTTPDVGVLPTLVSENLTALISAYDDDDYDYDDDSLEDGEKDGPIPYKGFLKFYFKPLRKKSAVPRRHRELENPPKLPVTKTTTTTDIYTPGWHWETKSPDIQKKVPTANAGNDDSFREELSSTTESVDFFEKSKNVKHHSNKSPQNRRKQKVLPLTRTQHKAQIVPTVEYESSSVTDGDTQTTKTPQNRRRNRPPSINRTKFHSSSSKEGHSSSVASTPFVESSTVSSGERENVPTSKLNVSNKKTSRLKASVAIGRPNSVTTSNASTPSTPNERSTTSLAEDVEDVPVNASVNRKENGRIRFPPRKAFEDFHFQPVRIKKIG